MKRPFKLIYDNNLIQHLAEIDKKHYSLIQETIREQLIYEPEVETLNRKPLVRPTDSGATWEIRFGPGNRFRVFYETDSISREVNILAIGIKERNRLFIGGKEYNL